MFLSRYANIYTHHIVPRSDKYSICCLYRNKQTYSNVYPPLLSISPPIYFHLVQIFRIQGLLEGTHKFFLYFCKGVNEIILS